MSFPKSLKPTMKEKKRYLLIKGKIDNVEDAILSFIGLLGLSKARPIWIKKEKNFGILSVNRESLNYVRASFAVWPDEIKIEKVSGTLKKIKEKIT
ncbi:MAG: hypothetical protein KatS3mg001_480 [Candidatus Pacearchaeota archaeon]|nr:MAG: hypothetical protein KatS3mg001_480 [Candidatus Pacearchaeota archaeon]